MQWPLHLFGRILPLLQSALPSSPKLSILNLRLTPLIDPLGVSSIEVYLDWPTKTKANTTIFTTQQSVGAVPLNDWADDIYFRDGHGELSLSPVDFTDDSGVRREWRTNRDVIGEVLLIYTVRARQADIYARCGPLLDLHYEPDALLGPGAGFLAIPSSSEDFDVRLTWDLSYVPGSRAVSSYGSGDVTFIAPATRLANIVFAAGELDSYAVPSDDFALFWIRAPPFDTDKLGPQLHELRTGMVNFFGTPAQRYSVFIRRNQHRCGSGTAFYNSFIFAYNAIPLPGGSEVQNLEFLAHEMVHDFLMLEKADVASYAELAWWTEGVAEYYSVELLHVLGLTDRETYVSRVNAKMYAYFTNAALHQSFVDLVESFWQDPLAQRMVYARGYMYFLVLGELISSTTTESHPSLDSLLREMARRKASGEAHDLPTWYGLVQSAIGWEKSSDLDDQLHTGVALVPSVGRMGPRYRLQSASEYQFDLGFPEGSLIPSGPDETVDELNLTSRAAVEGGLRTTDRLTLQSLPLHMALEDPKQEMGLSVLREGEIIAVRYLPRSWQEVETWRFELVDPGQT